MPKNKEKDSHIFAPGEPDFASKRKNRSRYLLLKTKPRRILIYGIKYLITPDEKDDVVVMENKSILVENGEIKKVLPLGDHKQIDLNKIDLIYDATKRGGLVVTPGFINAHSHPPMYILRSSMALAGEEGTIAQALETAIKLERQMTEEDLFYSSVADFSEEQKMGTTTTLSHYHTPSATSNAADFCHQRLIDAVSIASSTDPKASPEEAEKYIKSFKRKSFSSREMIRPALCIHYVYRASEDTLKKAKALMEKYNVLLTMHLSESEMDIQETIKRFGARPVEVLDKFGLLSKNLVLSHAVHLTPQEIDLLAKRKVGIVHLPTSNLIHKSGRLDYSNFFRSGLHKNMALGTDSVISKSRLDLITEALQARTMHQHSQVIYYKDLFKMITSNAAQILGLKKLGKIVPGYRADLSFWKLRDRGFIPYDSKDPSTLITNFITFGGRNIRDLMIDGQFVISNRVHNFVDESSLLDKIQDLHTNLRKKI
ncbi:amidohydrolase family protein [Patescibacteria group bacterium]|nr:amidohydrolase family protein [Patescibacteria group bacterium]